jgi:hypothetical protein
MNRMKVLACIIDSEQIEKGETGVQHGEEHIHDFL